MSAGMWDLIHAFRVRDLIDITIVAFVLYRIFLTFKGTLAVQMLAGLALLMGARFVAREAELYSIGFIMDNFWAFWVLALMVLFQPELRRALAQAGRSRLLERVFGEAAPERRHVVEEVIRAAESLAAKRVGALIVLERTGGLRNYAELGVPVDARVSAELLGSLFLPGSPLHDGAVFIQGGRISAAGCFLPLSRNLQLARALGTRHRAALGLSEETDAVVVVVSEETGGISLAVEGRMEPGLDAAELTRRLTELLGTGTRRAPQRGSLLAEVRRLTVRGKA
ncbi:MAG TPA: diadenylate cyclase CdaA [Methylomirabilota bacterium]|jgi:diadenylate cyclase|nr:diadenylate cyclase CdaA [Methylomirabilota bacterium]